MVDLQWTPAMLGGLTPSQLLVLIAERDPTERRYTAANHHELVARIEAERRAWETSSRVDATR